MSYVYAASDGFAVKIGVSDRPSARLSWLQTGNPRKINIIAQERFHERAVALMVERRVLDGYSNFRRCGEWIDAPAGPVVWFLSFVADAQRAVDARTSRDLEDSMDAFYEAGA
ncbi:MAG: GIY-YIG nuclease family protein [Egibacteraceae bacterium]